MGSLQKLRYFLVHSLPHVLVVISMLMNTRNDKCFTRISIQFLAAFIFNLATARIWPRLNIYSGSGSKEPGNSVSTKITIFPKKLRTNIRLFFASILFFGHILLFNYGKSSNSIANGIVFIFIRIFATFTSGGFNFSGKIIDVASSSIMLLSIMITAYSANLNIIYITGSIVCQLLGLTYFKMIIPAFQHVSRAAITTSLISFVLSSVCAVLIEGIDLNTQCIVSMLIGIMLWNPLSLSSMTRKNIEKKLYLLNYRLVIPIAFTLILHVFFRNYSIPISSLFSTAIIYCICYSASINFSDYFTSHPFMNSKSTLFFVISIFNLLAILIQCLTYSHTKSLYAASDCLFFLICLKWTLNEIWKTLSRKPTHEFPYGMGRISHIFSFSLSIIVFFFSFNIFRLIFFTKVAFIPTSFISTIIPLLHHIVIFSIFMLYPRKGSSSLKSIANAINFNACKDQQQTEINRVDAVDLICLICSVLGTILYNRNFDRVTSFIMTVTTLKIAFDAIRESAYVLVCAVPSKMVENLFEFKQEVESLGFVTAEPKINAWQNDDVLSIGSAKIDIQKDSVANTQQFLLFIISKFQKIGVLDVTVELGNREEAKLPEYGKDPISSGRNPSFIQI